MSPPVFPYAVTTWSPGGTAPTSPKRGLKKSRSHLSQKAPQCQGFLPPGVPSREAPHLTTAPLLSLISRLTFTLSVLHAAGSTHLSEVSRGLPTRRSQYLQLPL